MTTFLIYNGLGQEDQIIVPSNAITLTQDNGSIKVIEEIGNINVQGVNGNIIAKQSGKSLVYSKDASSSRLEYSTLNVPYGKTFEVTLSDGTYVHLNSGSSLRYPVQFIRGLKRQVFVQGEAFFDVSKDSLHPFMVSAAQLNVRVLGTKFNVSAYHEDEFTEIVLVEGSVSLFSTSNGYDPAKNTMLEPGYKASFEKRQEGITLTPVITDIYTSWRQGELAFRNMTLENILKKLERHYDIKIINKNAAVSKKRFNANFGNEPIIANVLEDLKRNYGIDYKIESEIITIY
jgi:ferric-dicitrate binding protein FerR (iron transport regulator)